ncbi:hemagglutinin repeat-containing protein, partial [Bartonella sp. TT119HLJHH]|uniref:hemagglutinin repeat-containing protein n=1 Tax=Bartonella sp. TT119HLJHH TaxID=3243579 RepID=UPI0035D04361
VSADRDVNIDAGNNITLSESYDTSNAKEKHEKSFAGVTTSVDIGVLGTVQGLKDAADHMNNKDGNNTVINGILTGMKISHLYSKGKTFVNWLTGNTGEKGNVTKGLSSSLGGLGGSTKDALANMAGASGSVTVGFKTEKTEASSQVSTAVTDSIEGGRAVNMQAHKGSIHGVGADIIAGTNPIYVLENDAQSGKITMEAGKDIIFESAQNTQSTQNSSESSSMSVGTGYGTGGAGATGSASFSQGEGSSEEVQHKNSHIIGTGTVHTTSGANTTLAGAVVSGERVEMEVGGDFAITSRSDTGQTSSKQNSVSVGFGAGQTGGGGSMSASFQKDKSSSDYHSVVEQSGIKA